MLEQSETAPARLADIIRWAERVALRTRVAGITLARNLQVQLMRLRRGIEMRGHRLPEKENNGLVWADPVVAAPRKTGSRRSPLNEGRRVPAFGYSFRGVD